MIILKDVKRVAADLYLRVYLYGRSLLFRTPNQRQLQDRRGMGHGLRLHFYLFLCLLLRVEHSSDRLISLHLYLGSPTLSSYL